MQYHYRILLLFLGVSSLLKAQNQRTTYSPLTVQVTTTGSVLFKPAPDAKHYGLLATDFTADSALVRQLENKVGMLIYSPETAKGKEHSLFTIGVLPTQKVELQTAKGDVGFEDINMPVVGRVANGNVTVKGGKANVSLQLQTGDIKVQQSQWQGSVMTRKGNIILEDSPLLEGHTPNGTVTHRYTEAGFKDKSNSSGVSLIQSFEKGRLELTGAIPSATLQLSEGQIVLEGIVDDAHLLIRDKGDITVKQAGKRLEVTHRKGTVDITAPTSFESLHINCEQGEVNLHLLKSFGGTVRILSEVTGREKPDFRLTNFWQSETPVFEQIPAEEKGKTIPGYFRYVFEKKLGEANATLIIHVKNAHLHLNAL